VWPEHFDYSPLPLMPASSLRPLDAALADNAAQLTAVATIVNKSPSQRLLTWSYVNIT
jgi:hypothetical protein